MKVKILIRHKNASVVIIEANDFDADILRDILAKSKAVSLFEIMER